jgi:virulence-associated protein VagC
MKAKVTEQGLVIPKQFLQGIQEVEIRQQNGVLLIVPIGKNDPILQLGSEPITDTVDDASINHDHYLYGS